MLKKIQETETPLTLLCSQFEMATQEEQRFLDGLKGGIMTSLEIVEKVSSMRIKYSLIEKKVVINNNKPRAFKAHTNFCFR